jgi:hypothetical protein
LEVFSDSFSHGSRILKQLKKEKGGNMQKRNAWLVWIRFLPALFLVSCGVTGLIASDNGEQKTPTDSAIGAGGGSDEAVAGGKQAGGSGAGGQDVSSTVESVPYGIYVRAVVTGRCGAYTNSGGFKNAEFEASFDGIVFVRPMGKGIPGPFGGLHRAGEPAAFSVTGGVSIGGQGTVDHVEYCPVYETEVDTHPVKITSGFNPFKATIGVMSPVASDAPQGVNPTKTPVGGGEAWIIFDIGDALNGGPILTYEVEGEPGQVQEDDLSLGPTRFLTTWDQLMRGKDFTITMTNGDEGETWQWEMSFHPQPFSNNP